MNNMNKYLAYILAVPILPALYIKDKLRKKEEEKTQEFTDELYLKTIKNMPYEDLMNLIKDNSLK